MRYLLQLFILIGFLFRIKIIFKFFKNYHFFFFFFRKGSFILNSLREIVVLIVAHKLKMSIFFFHLSITDEFA